MRMEDLNENYLALQVTFSSDNKTFYAKSNPMLSTDTNMIDVEDSVFNELNRFIEYDFRFVFKHKKELQKIYDDILNQNNDTALKLFNDYINIFREIVDKVNCDLPLLVYSLNTFIDTSYSLNNLMMLDFITPMNELWDELDGIIILQRDLQLLFEDFSEQQLKYTDRKNLPVLERLCNFNINVDLCYEDGEVHQTYLVSSAEILYSLLATYYFASKPNLAVCNYCNRFFEPKTKRVTLYCDRVTENNSTCKKEGAKAKFKDNIDSDPVLKKYNSEKHRILMYCNRSKLDEYDFFYDYYDWLDMFEPKIKEYKQGDLSAYELLNQLEIEANNFVPYSKDRHYTNI